VSFSLPDDRAAEHVHGDEVDVAGVRDECVPAAGGRSRVARLAEAGENVADLQGAGVDHGQLAEHRVGDDGSLPHALDAARPRPGRDVRAHDAELEVYHRDTRFGVGRDEREARRQRAQRERRRRRRDQELGSVHARTTRRRRREVHG